MSTKLVIHHIDVGQGDATLIEAPNGQVVLIDSGPKRSGRALVQYLNRHKIKRIDAFIATHGDEDHIGGMAWEEVFKGRLAPRVFYHAGLRGTASPTLTVGNLVRMMGRGERRRDIDLRDGNRLEEKFRRPMILGPETRGRFVAANGYVIRHEDLIPNEGPIPNVDTPNERSIAFYLEHGKFDYLITGDLIGRAYGQEDAEAEFELGKALQPIADSPQKDPVDMLHVGHHGANNASESRFLAAIRPETAVISCGEDNRHGHPHPETIARLKEAKIGKIYLTSRGVMDSSVSDPALTIMKGAVVVYSDGQSYEVCKEDRSSCENHSTD